MVRKIINKNARDILLVSTNFENLPDLMGARQPTEDCDELLEDFHYPLGIAYIHSYLESKKLKVDSFSFNSSGYKVHL